MNILELFRAIHSDDYLRILKVLKRAVYIDNLKLQTPTEGYHTGFKFRIHTGSEFELFFSFDEKDRIHLVYSFVGYRWFPLVAGLKLTRSERYFDRFYNDVFTGISVCHTIGHFKLHGEQDIISGKLSHPKFQVFRRSDDWYNKEMDRISDHAVIDEFPLFRIYQPAFYLRDGEFYSSGQNSRGYMDSYYDED